MPRDHARELSHTATVLAYLQSHPPANVATIREGIVTDGGPRIERIQRCIDDIDKSRKILVTPDPTDSKGQRKLYALGVRRTEPRLKKACRIPFPHPLVAEDALALREHLVQCAIAWVAQ